MAFWDLFLRPFKKVENPTFPITPAIIMQSLSGGVGAYDTTPDNGALRFSPVFAAERIIAETCASLPIGTYERSEDEDADGDDGATAVKVDPQYDLLRTKPNESQTPFALWDAAIKTAIRAGNAYIYIERDGTNNPIALRLLNSGMVTPRFGYGGKTFLYQSGYTIDNADVIHVMGFSTDGLVGLPLLYYAANAIAIGMAAEAAALRMLEKGTLAGGTIELDAWPSPEQFKQLRDSWDQQNGGVGNTGRTPIIPGGKYNPGTANLEQLQFLQLRRWQLLEVARIFRIPPHMLGDLERATFANIEQQSKEFFQNAISPWLVKIEQEINTKLFTPSQQGKYFARFNGDQVLRGDTQTRYNGYNIGLQAGFLTVNEVRCKENLPPMDGGDVLRSPLNMSNAGGAGAQPGAAAVNNQNEQTDANANEGGKKNGA